MHTRAVVLKEPTARGSLCKGRPGAQGLEALPGWPALSSKAQPCTAFPLALLAGARDPGPLAEEGPEPQPVGSGPQAELILLGLGFLLEIRIWFRLLLLDRRATPPRTNTGTTRRSIRADSGGMDPQVRGLWTATTVRDPFHLPHTHPWHPCRGLLWLPQPLLTRVCLSDQTATAGSLPVSYPGVHLEPAVANLGVTF